MSTTLFSAAFGVGTQNRQGAWLEVFYAQPLLNPSAELIAAIAPILGYTGGNQAITFSTAQAAQMAEIAKPIDTAQAALLEANREVIITLARLGELHIDPAGQAPKASASHVAQGCEVIVHLSGAVDFTAELARLDPFMLRAIPNFEPRKGPAVPDALQFS